MTTTSTSTETVTHDGCDRCGATARVWLQTAKGLPLTFCLHHDREHRDAVLQAGGRVVLDGTEALIKEETR